MMPKISWTLIGLSSLMAPIAWTQEKPPASDPTLCSYCNTTGKIENPLYERYADLLEGVKFCSWIMEKDPEGLGISWLPCKRCRNAELKARAEEEFAALAEERRAWLAERRKIDETLKVQEPLFHLETAHFQWAWSIPKLTFERKNYRDHEALHLFASLAEEFHAEFQAFHRITDAENYNNLHQLFYFERQTISRKACREYAGIESTFGKASKQMKPSVYVTWWDRNDMPTAEDLHCNMIHNLAHQFTAVHGVPWWLYETGFAYEGIAHWWEMHYYKRAMSYCFRELSLLDGWNPTRWESRVKKAVLAEENPSFTSLLNKSGGDLTAEEHLYAWSYVDYLISIDSRKILDFFDILKKKRPVREALLEVYQCSPLGFEEQWEAFVREKYKIQSDKMLYNKRIRRYVPQEQEEEE